MNPMRPGPPTGPPPPIPEGAPMAPPPMQTPMGPGPAPTAPLTPPMGAGPGPAGPGMYGPVDDGTYDGRPTMEEIGYEWADCCSVCEHFMPPEGCTEVNGHIRCDGVCPLFSERKGLPEAWGEDIMP